MELNALSEYNILTLVVPKIHQVKTYYIIPGDDYYRNVVEIYQSNKKT
jgi:hypothetical protein